MAILQQLEQAPAEVAVLVSGGVDSSLALALLAQSGLKGRLRAYYLKIWLEDELAYLGNCPWEEDLSFAGAVCDRLGVPLEVVPLQMEYYERVVSYAIDELKRGMTPSPDIFCNHRIKFGAFLDRVGGPDTLVASGHYARTQLRNGRAVLRRAPDPVKDQTYFLAHLDEARLRRILFPIGDLTKAEVRSLAATMNLPTKDRPDSQGICFLGKIRYPDFVRHYLGERPGPIVHAADGAILGEHRGYWFYTIGQRQGLGLGNGPWYVTGKDVDSNTVYVGSGAEAPKIAGRQFRVEEPHWIDDPPDAAEAESGSLRVKIRHGPQDVSCVLKRLPGGAIEVRMAEPDPGIAPGQFAVFYSGDYCLGGGIMSCRIESNGEAES